jgi:hypothetical protein
MIVETYVEHTISDGLYEYMFHLRVSDWEPIRMYRWADELAHADKDTEWLHDDDERDLHDSHNYKAGRNPLFLHLKRRFVKSMWALLEPFYEESEGA